MLGITQINFMIVKRIIELKKKGHRTANKSLRYVSIHGTFNPIS